jgi:hypothetical protein
LVKISSLKALDGETSFARTREAGGGTRRRSISTFSTLKCSGRFAAKTISAGQWSLCIISQASCQISRVGRVQQNKSGSSLNLLALIFRRYSLLHKYKYIHS